MTVEYVPLYPQDDDLANDLVEDELSIFDKNVQAGSANIINVRYIIM